MSDDEPAYIGVEKLTTHEDGSVTYKFHMSDEASEEIQQLGLKLILYCGVTQTDIQDVFDWILPPVDSTDIRPFDEEEVQPRSATNIGKNLKTCVSCGNPSTSDFCEFCLKEE